MNTAEALELLLREYPYLENKNTKIIKQFVAADGRVSNAFLVESSREGFERFVAKSFVHHPESLLKEWNALQLLLPTKVSVPALLDAPHKPRNFLLLEYVEGITAYAALESGISGSRIFSKVGETTGLLHTVQTDHVGDIYEKEGMTWKEYILNKIEKRKKVVSSFLSQEDYNKVDEALSSSIFVLDDESKMSPALLHHDIYLENFLFNEAANLFTLLDFGLALGGRPIFDLAKFYILDLSRFPKYRDDFLTGYTRYTSLPQNFKAILTFYIIAECFAMINFFHVTNDLRMKEYALTTLRDISHKRGAITSSIS